MTYAGQVYSKVKQKNNVITKYISRTALKEGFIVDVTLEKMNLNCNAICYAFWKKIIINSVLPIHYKRMHFWHLALHEIAHLSDDPLDVDHSKTFYKKLKRLKRKYPLRECTMGIKGEK